MLHIDPLALNDQMPEIIAELLTGSGAVILRNAFEPEFVDQARRLILDYSADQPRETHFQGANLDKLELQRRVWNLLNKGQVFEAMVQHETVAAIAAEFLGSRFILGSIAANRLLPGGPGQEPHIDYPYWDMYERGGFPTGINSSFPMNLQATIPLDPFTAETGASAFLAGSQRELSYPEVDDRDHFYANCDRMLGDPGDCILFNGMVWHCAMPNESDQDRSAILIEYLAKFVTPLEDQKAGVSDQVKARATPLMEQLLSLTYPYPKLFDEAEAEVQIGRDLEPSN